MRPTRQFCDSSQRKNVLCQYNLTEKVSAGLQGIIYFAGFSWSTVDWWQVWFFFSLASSLAVHLKVALILLLPLMVSK